MQVAEVHVLAKHFSELVGRRVVFKKAAALQNKNARSVYATYEMAPADDPAGRRIALVRADLELLGALAGSLVGLPNDEVGRRLKTPVLDELMHDAIYEILNVASAVIGCDCRTTLTEMAMRAEDVKGDAAQILATPALTVPFDVTVQDYAGGRLSVLG